MSVSRRLTLRLTRPCRRAKPAGTGRVEPRVRQGSANQKTHGLCASGSKTDKIRSWYSLERSPRNFDTSATEEFSCGTHDRAIAHLAGTVSLKVHNRYRAPVQSNLVLWG